MATRSPPGGIQRPASIETSICETRPVAALPSNAPVHGSTV
jgi:hypothetical protein